MPHTQYLIDKAQEYADAFYAYFPYGSIFVYGLTPTDPYVPYYSAASYMPPMNFLFFAEFDERNGLGEYGPLNASNRLVTNLLNHAAMYHDSSLEVPFTFDEPSMEMLTEMHAQHFIGEPYAILRSGGPHIALVP
jgi:hypothetical protein